MWWMLLEWTRKWYQLAILLYQVLTANSIISRNSRILRPKQIPSALLETEIKINLMPIQLLNVMDFTFLQGPHQSGRIACYKAQLQSTVISGPRRSCCAYLGESHINWIYKFLFQVNQLFKNKVKNLINISIG